MPSWKVWVISIAVGAAVGLIVWGGLELIGVSGDGGVLGNPGLAILLGLLGWSTAMYRLGPHLDFNRPSDARGLTVGRSTDGVGAPGDAGADGAGGGGGAGGDG